MYPNIKEVNNRVWRFSPKHPMGYGEVEFIVQNIPSIEGIYRVCGKKHRLS